MVPTLYFVLGNLFYQTSNSQIVTFGFFKHKTIPYRIGPINQPSYLPIDVPAKSYLQQSLRCTLGSSAFEVQR